MIERRAAKELIHIRDWLERAAEIARRGEAAYLGDDLPQEAGDSLEPLFARAVAVVEHESG